MDKQDKEILDNATEQDIEEMRKYFEEKEGNRESSVDKMNRKLSELTEKTKSNKLTLSEKRLIEKVKKVQKKLDRQKKKMGV